MEAVYFIDMGFLHGSKKRFYLFLRGSIGCDFVLNSVFSGLMVAFRCWIYLHPLRWRIGFA